MNTENPHLDWDRWIAQQQSTHSLLRDPTSRLTQALNGRGGCLDAEIGEYGREAELLTDLVRAAVVREVFGRGSDWDIARRAKALAAEVSKNRDARYWQRVDESRRRAVAARSAA